MLLSSLCRLITGEQLRVLCPRLTCAFLEQSQVMKDDNEAHKGSPFLTSTRGRTPPLVTSNFVVQDDGNCSPRFMRCTMYNIPCNKDLLQASSIPLATVITPFAETGPSEVSNVIISRTLRPKTNRRKISIQQVKHFGQ